MIREKQVCYCFDCETQNLVVDTANGCRECGGFKFAYKRKRFISRYKKLVTFPNPNPEPIKGLVREERLKINCMLIGK